MRQKRFTLSNLLLYIIIGVCMIAIQCFNFCERHVLTVFESSLVFAVIVILSLFYFIGEHKNHNLKVRPVIITVLFALFIVNIVSVAMLPTSYSIPMTTASDQIFTFTAEISNDVKIVSVISTGIALYTAYLFLAVIPQKIHSLKQLKLVFYGIILLAFAAVIYSFIKDAQSYSDLFNGIQSGRSGIVSFTNNSNNFAAIIFFGIASCIYMHHITKNMTFYFLLGFLALAIVFTLSRTYAISSYALILGYLLFRAIYEFKNHKIKVIVSSSILLLVAAGFFVPYTVCYFGDSLKSFPPFVVTNLFIERLTSGLSGREYVWKQTIEVINYTNSWVYGMGFGMFDSLFYNLQFSKYEIHASSSSHNGALQIIVDGGIILAVLIVLLFAFSIYASIRIYKKHKRLFWLNLIMIISLLFQMVFESAAPFAPGITIFSYCFMTIFMFVPVLSAYYQEKHGVKYKLIEPNRIDNSQSGIGPLISQGFAFILTLFYILMAGIFLPWFRTNNTVFILFVVIAHSFILVPFLLDVFRLWNFHWKPWFFNIFLPYTSAALIGVSICHVFAYFAPKTDFMFVMLIILISTLYLAVFTIFVSLRKNTGFVGKFITFILFKTYTKIFIKKEKIKKNHKVPNDEVYYETIIDKLEMFHKK